MKRGLLQCLQLQEPVEQEDTVIIGDCESVDKWYIVLNGEMSWKRASTVQRVYHVGDCFGITQNLRTYHQSGLIVASKECQVCIAFLLRRSVCFHGNNQWLKVTLLSSLPVTLTFMFSLLKFSNEYLWFCYHFESMLKEDTYLSSTLLLSDMYSTLMHSWRTLVAF